MSPPLQRTPDLTSSDVEPSFEPSLSVIALTVCARVYLGRRVDIGLTPVCWSGWSGPLLMDWVCAS
jgi:hypothetical protein